MEIDLTVPQMVQGELIYDSANPLQDPYTRGMKTYAPLYVNIVIHKYA